MSKKRKVYVIMTVVFFVLICGCINSYINLYINNITPSMVFAIYPTGGTTDMYYYTIYKNGIIISYFGNVPNPYPDIKVKPIFETIYKIRVWYLSNKNIQTLLNLADEVEQSGAFNEEYRSLDTWNVKLLYQNIIYVTSHHSGTSEPLDELTDKIIKLSPIHENLWG